MLDTKQKRRSYIRLRFLFNAMTPTFALKLAIFGLLTKPSLSSIGS